MVGSLGPGSGFDKSSKAASSPPRDALYPKLFSLLKGYTRRDFVGDLWAGIVVGVVALPLAIAFAIASGVAPEKGLVTAVVAGFLISALGGSRVQIGGPTGAFVVIVYGIVEKYGVSGLAIATFMAGAMLVAMGLARLGSLMRFIPHPVIVGFTSGIAVIIASTQARDFFGLGMPSMPSEFFAKWAAIFRHVGTVNVQALGLGVLCVAVLMFWPKVSRKVPASLVGLILCTVLARWFNLSVETVGSRFGSIPGVFPAPHLPDLEWEILRNLVQPAIAIALLAGIESLLSATVADGMIGGRHRPNMELVAQGIANIASPLFGGIPATGAIARTATNVKNGGRTPIAGIVHALTLLGIMLVLGRYAVLIPLSCLAAILLVVAYHMSEWRTFVALFRGPRADIAVLLTTFVLTVVVDLTVAITTGVVLALLLFMKQMSEAFHVGPLANGQGQEDILERGSIPEGVEVYEVNGPLFFGAAQKFEEAITAISLKPKALILRLRNLLSLDASGLHALQSVHKNCERQGIVLILSGVHVQPTIALFQSGLADKIGEANLFPNFEPALERAREVVGSDTALTSGYVEG